MILNLNLISFNLILINMFKVAYSENISSSNATTNFEKPSEVLSRKKRFLIFPEGSSLQLVFCLTYPTLFNIGEIFLWGTTAALAWELPQDPYSPFRHHADPLHRRVDTKTVYYTDDIGHVLFQHPYKRKSILNPAFAKRSINEPSKSETRAVNATEFKKGTSNSDEGPMHKAQYKREFLETKLMDEFSRYFHRSSRVGLYEKVEALFKALGSDGRQCLLKALCQTGQTRHIERGEFLEELLRAVFTLPDGPEFKEVYHMEYDEAHRSTDSCHTLYPGCDSLTLDPTSPLFSY